MNIFILDINPLKAAQYHHDAHVVKMILESAQLLCTSINVMGGSSPYKTVSKNHPCAIWARQTRENWKWLKYFSLCLCKEYTYRYGKNHKSERIIRSLSCELIPNGLQTPFAQAMPNQYKNDNPVHAYREYYYNEKQFIVRSETPRPVAWTHREKPEFMLCTDSEFLRNCYNNSIRKGKKNEK